MTAKDQYKLLLAGFTILRQGISPQQMLKTIKAKTPERNEWHILESGFKSEAAVQRRIEELLNDPKTVLE